MKANLQVSTKQGTVEGLFDSQIRVREFYGVPFAQPPVRELRWKAPQPPIPWMGVRKCDRPGPWSVQRPTEDDGGSRLLCYGPEYFIPHNAEISEDCLYLNVWTPADADPNSKLPVYVIIHGGGFIGGSGAVSILNGKRLASEGIVVVTINYRLGAFCFLTHSLLAAEDPGGHCCNYAFLDQIAALRWVQENIAAFGGDPNRVTVGGESGGAMSTSILCQTPLAKGLFAQAVAQSGALHNPHSYFEPVTPTEAAVPIQAALEAAGIHTLEEMRAAPAEALLNLPITWQPTCDDYLWMHDSVAHYRPIPLLLGSNSDEGWLFKSLDLMVKGVAEQTPEAENLMRTILADTTRKHYGSNAEAAENAYLSTNESAFMAANREYGDRCFGYPMRYWANCHTATQRQPVYLYYYDRAVPGIPYGAFHTAELEYFYDNQHCTPALWEFTDRLLCKTMKQYLLNFVKTGDPNGLGLPQWRTVAEAPEDAMELGEHIGMIPYPRTEAFAILEKHFGK